MALRVKRSLNGLLLGASERMWLDKHHAGRYVVSKPGFPKHYVAVKVARSLSVLGGIPDDFSTRNSVIHLQQANKSLLQSAHRTTTRNADIKNGKASKT